MDISLLGITNIEVYLQPIISINKKKIFGYEALVRAYKDEEYVSPPALFNEAKKNNQCINLDLHLRLVAIKKFHKYYMQDKKALLFLNFQASTINENFQQEQQLFEETLQQMQISPKNIVLEIKEDSIKSTEALSDFIYYFRKKGFIIAIDDFGTGSSQYERLAIVKPDIVKIDRSLLTNIDKNYIHAEIVKSIANMCHTIGAVVLAEGVEQESEILKCLNFDIQIYQGYFFSRPQKEITESLEISHKIESLRLKHGEYLKNIIFSNRTLFLEASYITNKIVEHLDENDFLHNAKIQEILHKQKDIEALYLIESKSAKQKGNTLFLGDDKGFYEPSEAGEDHSLKEYFYICKNSKDGEYMSRRYISSASGSLCKTYSKKIMFNDVEYIFCLDIYETILHSTLQ